MAKRIKKHWRIHWKIVLIGVGAIVLALMIHSRIGDTFAGGIVARFIDALSDVFFDRGIES